MDSDVIAARELQAHLDGCHDKAAHEAYRKGVAAREAKAKPNSPRRSTQLSAPVSASHAGFTFETAATVAALPLPFHSRGPPPAAFVPRALERASDRAGIALPSTGRRSRLPQHLRLRAEVGIAVAGERRLVPLGREASPH